MPATKADREEAILRFGTTDDERIIERLHVKGWMFLKRKQRFLPPSRQHIPEDWELFAIQFLCDEWGYMGIEAWPIGESERKT